MLDENLPVFFLKPSTTGINHYRTLDLSHRGSDPEPAYTLQYLDPNSTLQAHKNCYAAALFDPHNPEVLFGEVLVRPSWTQPSLSQEEIRRHGGIPAPPEPRVPGEFNIQLYNPDQQVTIHMKEGKWGSSDTFEFSIPERTFRAPSASSLDRSQSDPGSLDITPRIKFAWKRESKLSKDLTCFMIGKSTDTEKKKSKRDPDIAVALWRSLREMTLYESNLSRMDTEDPKGLEVSLLMSAIVIKDLYFSSRERLYELFNIQGTGRRRTSSQGRGLANGGIATIAPPQKLASPNTVSPVTMPQIKTPPATAEHSSQPPPPDPREKWQIEAETVRLRQIAEAEARDAQKRKKEREKAEEAERKRLQKIFEQEQKDARRRADEIERETQRLRRIYGTEGQSLRPEPNVHQRDHHSRRSFQGTLQSVPQGRASSSSSRQSLGSNALVYDTPVMSGGNPDLLGLPGQSLEAKKKKSIFSLRSLSDELAASTSQGRLTKKQSTIW